MLSPTPGRIDVLTAVDAGRRAAGSFQPHLTVIPGRVGWKKPATTCETSICGQGVYRPVGRSGCKWRREARLFVFRRRLRHDKRRWSESCECRLRKRPLPDEGAWLSRCGCPNAKALSLAQHSFVGQPRSDYQAGVDWLKGASYLP